MGNTKFHCLQLTALPLMIIFVYITIIYMFFYLETTTRALLEYRSYRLVSLRSVLLSY